MMNNKKCFKENTVVALGNFDGLHIGHKAVLKNTIEIGLKKNLKPVAMIFFNFPNRNDKLLLVSENDKINAIKKLGLEVFLIDFCDISYYSPERFVKEILAEKLNAKEICCGYNYHFGRGGNATADDLNVLCNQNGLKLNISRKVLVGGVPISSSRIRELLKNGEIEKANSLLNDDFNYSFLVVDGDKRGRTIGFPTINQYFPHDFIVPKFGVYASVTTIDEKKYFGVTNIGSRPTIGTHDVRSETNIIGYNGNLYGKKINVSLKSYLREEMKFESIEQLKNQIENDTLKAKQYFENNKKATIDIN